MTSTPLSAAAVETSVFHPHPLPEIADEVFEIVGVHPLEDGFQLRW
ncbi:hypothetical protein ACLI4Y_09740 [Natrialbaceae archaeon A-CW3]